MTTLKKYEWLIAIGVILLFTLLLHSQIYPSVADTDGFYHIRHAWEYRTDGIFQTAFPWTQYSSINTQASDLWYGFHILLIPFTFFTNLLNGIYLGAFFVTATALTLVFWALKRLQVKWPLLLTILFAILTADLMYRLTMLRPHPISLALSLLLFSFWIEKPRRLKDLYLPTLIAAIFTWMHISLAWVMVIVLVTIITVRLFQKEKLGMESLASLAVGGLIGWLARPNPLGSLQLAYIQVIKLMSLKNLPLRFGRELTPFVWENFIDQLIPITLLLALATIFFWSLVRKKMTNTALWSSGLLTLLFLGMTFGIARRSNELFVGFAIIFIALLFSSFVRQINRRSVAYHLSMLVVLVALIIAPIKNVYRVDTYVANAFSPTLFQPAGEWLAQNAKPKEIIFNVHWDRFGELFFWNPNNYYINGMDPVFEYDFNPQLYWETHFYAIDKATEYTCRAIRCTSEEVVATYQAIKNDFKASYVVLEKRRNPSLNKYLSTAPQFKKSFEDPGTIVYKVL